MKTFTKSQNELISITIVSLFAGILAIILSIYSETAPIVAMALCVVTMTSVAANLVSEHIDERFREFYGKLEEEDGDL